MNVNRSTEDYIKAIYKLQRKHSKVITSALAAELRLANPSITDMIQKLSRKGYVRYVPYQGVLLTEKGRHMALKILRRHRLWEMYLVRFLKYSWDEVHDEAERLEHVTSDELEERLDNALGWPTRDPHGDPIPTKEGEVDVKEGVPLALCVPGSSARVCRVSDHNRKLLEQAAQVGLILNRRVTVKENRRFDGSILVQVGSRQKYITQKVANAVFVQPVK